MPAYSLILAVLFVFSGWMASWTKWLTEQVCETFSWSPARVLVVVEGTESSRRGRITQVVVHNNMRDPATRRAFNSVHNSQPPFDHHNV
ncbi:hypothetical protein KC19_9G047800 [Ceratodon purpureus]|uniref:Uncharacterized protein n=1 Tax=Ceratodon purpureus TaxID=3225 RepID=A0A8T0GNS7_CERPU|nr:hypothetical protein KC19_9G047800 [Ceratodon purpureus]